MEGSNLARIGETESRTVLFKGLALVECLEYELAFLLRNAHTVVLHAYYNIFILFLDDDVDLGIGILYGVGKQVADNAFDSVCIADRHDGVIGERGGELESASLGCRLEGVDGFAHDGADILGREYKVCAAAVHLAEVQKVVAEFLEPLDIEAHGIHVVLDAFSDLAFGNGLVQQDLQHRHRGPDLVGNIGEEIHLLVCEILFFLGFHKLETALGLSLAFPVLLVEITENQSGQKKHVDQPCQFGTIPWGND